MGGARRAEHQDSGGGNGGRGGREPDPVRADAGTGGPPAGRPDSDPAGGPDSAGGASGGQDRAGPEDSGARVVRLHPAKRIALGTVGGVLLVVGIALLVLPGPGMLLVLAGLILLSRAIPAVARWVEPVRAKAMQATEASVAVWWRVAGTALAGLGLIAAGVVWGADLIPRLPFSGWSTGSSLILSGLILLGLLVWSYRRVHCRPGSGPRA